MNNIREEYLFQLVFKCMKEDSIIFNDSKYSILLDSKKELLDSNFPEPKEIVELMTKVNRQSVILKEIVKLYVRGLRKRFYLVNEDPFIDIQKFMPNLSEKVPDLFETKNSLDSELQKFIRDLP